MKTRDLHDICHVWRRVRSQRETLGYIGVGIAAVQDRCFNRDLFNATREGTNEFCTHAPPRPLGIFGTLRSSYLPVAAAADSSPVDIPTL